MMPACWVRRWHLPKCGQGMYLMLSPNTILLVLCALVGLLLGLATWGFLQLQNQALGDTRTGVSNDLLSGLLVLAVFAFGVFVTFFLFRLPF